MNVKELREALERFPDDYDVKVRFDRPVDELHASSVSRSVTLVHVPEKER